MVEIRPARPEDSEALCEIIDEVDALHREHLPHIFQKPAGPVRERDYLLGLMADDEAGLFVAELEGRLVGFVDVIVRDTVPLPLLVPRRVAIVDNLAVQAGHRRSGIGQALMETAQEWAAARGATSIELNVYAFNQAAIAFYQRLGYQTHSFRLRRPLPGPG